MEKKGWLICLRCSRPHLLPATELYNAHLSPQLVPIQAELEERLRSTRARNEELVALIHRQREEVESLVKGLEAVVSDLEGANEVLGPVVGSVREEMMQMAEEGRGGKEARV